MTNNEAEADKKYATWLEFHGKIYSRHADYIKAGSSGIIEYGKMIIQSLFALNAAGIASIPVVVSVVRSGGWKMEPAGYLWSAGFFVGGCCLALICAFFSYYHFNKVYEEGVAEYSDEVRMTFGMMYKQKTEPDFDIPEIERSRNLMAKMAKLCGSFSIILFSIGCFSLLIIFLNLKPAIQ